jgi:four helix bundle protein
MLLNSAKDLEVYKKAFKLSMRVFELTRHFPSEEKFALTSQVRRSSRFVCLNLREAWAKRRYESHFISKLTDCDGENSETDSSIDFARDCGYITNECHEELTGLCREIGKMLGSMIQNPAPFLKNRLTYAEISVRQRCSASEIVNPSLPVSGCLSSQVRLPFRLFSNTNLLYWAFGPKLSSNPTL